VRRRVYWLVRIGDMSFFLRKGLLHVNVRMEVYIACLARPPGYSTDLPRTGVPRLPPGVHAYMGSRAFRQHFRGSEFGSCFYATKITSSQAAGAPAID